jgi:hypothetical protein
MNKKTRLLNFFQSDENSKSKIPEGLKKFLMGSFLFFLIKGIIWILLILGLSDLF